jgi:suppressor of fused protein SUFU
MSPWEAGLLSQPRPGGDIFIESNRGHSHGVMTEAGETMDIEDFFGDSTLRAMLFTHPGEQPVHFEFLGQRYALLLCIGITAEELAFARSRSTAELLTLLKQHGVFPYTIPGRPSVWLPPGLFGR